VSDGRQSFARCRRRCWWRQWRRARARTWPSRRPWSRATQPSRWNSTRGSGRRRAISLPQEKLHPAFKALIAATKADRRKDGLELHVANALWGQKGFTFLEPFLRLTRENYGAGLRTVDFRTQAEAARLTINKWVEEQTREKIKDLLQRGVLNGQSPFKKRATRERPFTLLDGTVIKAPTMHQTAHFAYAEADDVQVLEMPYKSGKAAMVILLPKKKDGLPALEKALNAAALAGWLEGLQRQQVAVSLPKVETTCTFELKPTLSAMGMSDAFLWPAADFSGMTGGRDLFISAVIHKAFVRVDEKGTEAAAATAVVMTLGMAPMQPVVFNADHPFLFLLRDKRTGSILFIGRVMDPRK